MRRRDIGKEDRSKLISEAIRKMKGKIPEIAGSHVSSRVLQICVKYCSQAEKETVFTELQAHFLNLASNKYYVHLLKKMLDGASKQQLTAYISSLWGHVASLLRHPVGSVVLAFRFQFHRLLHRHLPRFLRVSLAQLRRIWNLIIILYMYRFLQIKQNHLNWRKSSPELAYDSPPKQEDCVANPEKDAPVSQDDAEKTKKKEEVEKDDAKGEAMEEEKGEENDGERTEKEPVTPISERPVRERKRTERYSLDTPPQSSGNKPVSIEQGRGTRLKEIPNVAYKLSKRKPDDNLFLLHTILYGKKGKAQMLKKNIGQFSGFVWSEQEEEKQRARAKEKLEKCIKEKFIDFCDVLDIPINKSNVKKEELAVRVLEFLVYPKATRDIQEKMEKEAEVRRVRLKLLRKAREEDPLA